jgi:hypothetical protein
MKRIFLSHLEIIAKKTGIHLSSYRIVDQLLCFKNDHFLLQKLDKLVFHKNLFDFFVQFPSVTFENTLLIDYTPHKSFFNPPFSAIIDVLPNDPQYAKLITPCFAKCDEMFCNQMKPKSLNKRR